MEPEPIRIVIADQNKLYRQTLCNAIENEANLQVVSMAEDGLAAIHAVERHRPDVAVMGISMQVINGLDATWVITHRFPGVKVILLSAYDMQTASEVACKMGACCCLEKGCSPKELIRAIRTAAN
jgi:two-component system nitrate/nitrite response regulator NarL